MAVRKKGMAARTRNPVNVKRLFPIKNPNKRANSSSTYSGTLILFGLISPLLQIIKSSTSKLNFFVTLKRSSKFIFFKAPVEVARITAYPTHSSSLSINSTPNTLNVIFNYSNKLTTHENKKTHKKNHKPNSKKKH